MQLLKKGMIGIFIAVVLLLVLVQLSFFQTWILQKVAHNLSKQWQTEVSIKKVKISFFSKIILQDLLLRDQTRDTLLYTSNLTLEIDHFAPFRKAINFNKIHITGIQGKGLQEQDSSYNFDFLIAPSETQEPIKKNEPWEINLDELEISQSYFSWSSKPQHLDLAAHIEDFRVEMQNMDLQKRNLAVALIHFSESQINIKSGVQKFIDEPLIISSDTIRFPWFGWTIAIQKLDLLDNEFGYRAMDNQIVSKDFLDLQNMFWQVDKIAIQDFFWESDKIKLDLTKMELVEKQGYQIVQAQSKFKLTPAEFQISNLFLQTQKSQIDNSTTITFGDPQKMWQNLEQTSFTSSFQHSQITWQDLKPFLPLKIRNYYSHLLPESNLHWLGSIKGDFAKMKLQDLHLEADRNVDLTINGDINDLQNLDKTSFAIKLDPIAADYSGLKKWLPMLDVPAGLQKMGRVVVRGEISGRIDDINAQHLNITTDATTNFVGDLVVKGLPEVNKLVYIMTIESLQTAAEDWTGYLPQGEFVTKLDSLGKVEYRGTIEGDSRNLSLRGDWSTQLGELSSTLEMEMESFSPSAYKADFDINNWNLAPLVKNTIPLGHFTGSFAVEGTGKKFADLNATVKGNIDSINFKDYTYEGLSLEISLEDQVALSIASSIDPNLFLKLEAQLNLKDSLPIISLNLDCDSVHLYPLHFTNSPLQLQGKAVADLRGNSLETLNGRISLSKLLLSNDSIQYFLDSMIIEQEQIAGKQYLSLSADNDLEVTLEGEYSWSDLPKIATHFSQTLFPDHLSAVIDTAWIDTNTLVEKPFWLTAHISMLNPDELLRLVDPGWKRWDTLALDATWDSQNQSWDMSVIAGPFNYLENRFEKLRLTGAGIQDSAFLNVIIDSMLLPGQADLFNLSLNNKLQNDSIKSHLVLANGFMPRLFEIASIFTRSSDYFQVSFTDTLFLANKAWLFSYPRDIHLGRKYLYFNDIQFVRNGRRVSLNSQNSGDNKVGHTLTLVDFPLGDISTILDMQDLSFKGKANGKIQIQELEQFPVVTADLHLGNLLFNNDPVGDLAINAAYGSNEEEVQIQANLTGNNALAVNGAYIPKQKTGNFKIAVDSLQFALLENFSIPQLSDFSGYLQGEVEVAGSLNKPQITGRATLVNARSFIDYLKGSYDIPQHTIKITQNEIDFGSMELFDINRQKARLSGKITHQYFNNIRYDLDFQTDQFQLLNTTAADNDLFYGKLLLGLTMQLKGGLYRPNAQINAKTLKGTEIYFVSPALGGQTIEQADFILYGKPNSVYTEPGTDTLILRKNYVGDTTGIDLFMNLEVNPNSAITIILDPETGDQLTCQGKAQISVDQDATGAFQITGNYLVEDGSYYLNYENIFKRNFKIKSGSEIKFTGNPMDSRFDITATYTARTSLFDLIKQEAAFSPEEQLLASQKADVLVVLHLEGNLSAPKISFDIQLPEAGPEAIYSAVNNKLAQIRDQENDLNTQVFGLLLFNSFVSVDQSAVNLTNTGEELVLSSVSNFLTQQLTRLADKLGTGVDVKLGIESYQTEISEEERNITQLQLGLTKKALDDRLTINVGGNLDVYSHESGSISEFTTLAGDFVLTYVLNKQGNYRLRVFRRSNFDLLSESNIHKSGIGVSFNKSFKRKDKKKER